jgi:hypothetical protein
MVGPLEPTPVVISAVATTTDAVVMVIPVCVNWVFKSAHAVGTAVAGAAALLPPQPLRVMAMHPAATARLITVLACLLKFIINSYGF